QDNSSRYIQSYKVSCLHTKSNMDPADNQKKDVLDHWILQEMEETLRNLPDDLKGLPSLLLLEKME
ncbi:hypothetical protein ATANTOWER_010113, partial [Ataeniobius toweri]|nr:hypothetical protein [Ataeniobius toweri]